MEMEKKYELRASKVFFIEVFGGLVATSGA
jgi:hypothetical protein